MIFVAFPIAYCFGIGTSMMLANVLLRTYNKELDVDVEMTPEEVLNIFAMDWIEDVVNYAQLRIDSQEYRFATKIRKNSRKTNCAFRRFQTQPKRR